LTKFHVGQRVGMRRVLSIKHNRDYTGVLVKSFGVGALSKPGSTYWMCRDSNGKCWLVSDTRLYDCPPTSQPRSRGTAA
jgi:hypothetical protein